MEITWKLSEDDAFALMNDLSVAADKYETNAKDLRELAEARNIQGKAAYTPYGRLAVQFEEQAQQTRKFRAALLEAMDQANKN